MLAEICFLLKLIKIIKLTKNPANCNQVFSAHDMKTYYDKISFSTIHKQKVCGTLIAKR